MKSIGGDADETAGQKKKEFNLILFGIFGIGGLLISLVAYSFLMGNARREVLAQAELMMASADKSVRDYTTTDLLPLLLQVPGHRVRVSGGDGSGVWGYDDFPRICARSHVNYTYKEATLNPTNLRDRTSDWEADVIRDMPKDHPEKNPVVGDTYDSGLAFHRSIWRRPIVRDASLSGVSQWGVPSGRAQSDAHGLWLVEWIRLEGKNAVVGAQIVSVPALVPTAIANQAFHRLLIYLVLTLVFTVIALDLGVYWLVILATQAGFEYSGPGSVQRRKERAAGGRYRQRRDRQCDRSPFNRMQLSLVKAFAMLGQRVGERQAALQLALGQP